MKCNACGKDNVQDARFCAFCGAGMPAQAPVAEETPQAEAPVFRQTAKPLSDNPYQPPRAPVIHSAQPAQKPAEPTKAEETEKEAPSPRQIIPPAPKRVFLFDEELEEEKRKAASAKRSPIRLKGLDDDEDEDELDDYEEFEEYDDYGHEFDDDEEDDEDDYEEDEPTGGRIFVRVFSVLTILILIVGVGSFLYGTTVGRRLLASAGMTGRAEDYLILADWQLRQNSTSDASDSYYNAFKLAQDDYDLALTVGTGFESCGDLARAEQMYSYLITTYPQKDEPYDRLMALLNRQGRTEQYESLLNLRSSGQAAGYTPPQIQIPDAPVASHQGGAYTGSIQLTFTSAGGEIRYTLDGTAPTASSFLYSGPITLTAGTHNLRVVVIENGQMSAEWTGSFVIS